MRCLCLAASAVLFLAACQAPTQPPLIARPVEKGVYDYPLENPLAATVIGTPAEFRADLPQDYDVEEIQLTLFPDRPVPEIFWYDEKLAFSVAKQDGPAPLVFSIGGTGSDHRSRLMKVIQAILVGYGFHVISIASPTHPNFVIAGSETAVPGRVMVDVRDLYRAMRAAYAQVADEVEVTEFYLTGYSLGGWQAAFISQLDEEEEAFGFKKVLLVDPPVSLFDSISLLDRMLEDGLPNGIEGIDEFFDEAFDAFSTVYKRSEFVDFTDEFLYRAYQYLSPSDDSLRALIGLAFRLAAHNMAFTADVMNGGGYIVPRGLTLRTTTSLTPFFQAGARAGFMRYLREFYAPYYMAREPGLGFGDLIEEAKLSRIEDYLRDARKIGLIANADDIILGPGDIDYLREVFGDRAVILPSGGHLGNIEHRYVVATIGDFFRK